MTSTSTSTESTRMRYGAAVLALAPVVMAGSILAHPFIPVMPDSAAIADAVQANTMGWAIVHLASVIGIALTALAFLAIRARLREAGENRSSQWALPWVLFGSALYGFLPGLEFAPVAAARTGGNPAAAQESLTPFFIAVLAVSAITFAIGVVGFAKAIATSRVLSPTLTWVVAVALVLLAISRMVPLGAVQFFVQAAAVIVAFWPLAYEMWPRHEVAHATQGRPAVT